MLVFAVILLPLLACALGTSHIENAREAAAEGDTAKAFEEYRLALEEDDLEPAERFTALVERGDLYREQQDWDEALADYDAAVAVTNEDGTPAGDQNSAYSKQFDTLLERADSHQADPTTTTFQRGPAIHALLRIFDCGRGMLGEFEDQRSGLPGSSPKRTLPVAVLLLHVLSRRVHVAPAALKRRGLEDRARTREPIEQTGRGYCVLNGHQRRKPDCRMILRR